MHLYASTHKVHSVDTLHSDALAFLRIQAHSNAFTHTRIQGECRPPKGLAQLQDSCMLARLLLCKYVWSHSQVHSCAFWRIHVHSCVSIHVSLALSPLGVSCVCVDHESGAFVRICAHSDAFEGIVVHSHASCSMYQAIIAVRGACSKSGNTNLCTWMHHS